MNATTKLLSTASIVRETFNAYRWHIVALVFLGFLSGALEGIGIGAVVPLLSFLVGNGGVSNNAISSFIIGIFDFTGIHFSFRYVLGFILFLFFLRAIVVAVSTYIRAYVSADFISKETAELFGKTLRANWSFLLKQKTGYLQTTIIKDAQKAGGLFEVFAQVIQSFTGFLMYLTFAISISSRITAITLILGSALVFLLRPLVRKTREVGEKLSQLEKEISHRITENILGLKTIKTAGEEAPVFEEMSKNLFSIKGLFTKGAFISSLGPVFFQPIGLIFIVIVFALVYHSPGFNVTLFAATVYLIQKIFVYLESGQNALHAVNSLAPYAGNINAYKDQARLSSENFTGAGNPFSFERKIEFRNVSLSYEGRGEILSGINLTINKGEMIGIIGPSGAGKTSLADIMLRLFNPTSGDIYIDGKPLSSVSLKDWRKHIGYVSQDLFLIHESIENNIRFYDKNLSHEDIVAAAKKAYIFDVVNDLPNGFDTHIGDRGVTLSAGQRQRIVLARVLARNFDILILDEATSALDSESELFIKKAIEELHGKVTIVVIAHRLSTIMGADRLIAIDKGVIVEEGSPEVLAKDKNSYFYRLSNAHKLLL